MSEDKTTRKRSRPPARTIEGREEELIMEAYDEAERRILNGTASSQLILHFVKQGSKRERLEQESIVGRIELDRAKIKSLETDEQILEMYQAAIEAMTAYGGKKDE